MYMAALLSQEPLIKNIGETLNKLPYIVIFKYFDRMFINPMRKLVLKITSERHDLIIVYSSMTTFFL
jgi:hypothetical protein